MVEFRSISKAELTGFTNSFIVKLKENSIDNSKIVDLRHVELLMKEKIEK